MNSRVLARIRNSKYLNNFAILASGTVIAQLVGLVASPVLSRIFSPENFGIYGAFLSVTGIVAVIGSFKYEMALVVERDDKNAYHLQVLCFLILGLVVFLSFIAFGFFPKLISNAFDNPNLITILPLGFIVIALTGTYDIFNFRLNRELEYKTSAKASVLQRIVIVVFQIAVGLFSASAITLVLGNILGLTLSAFLILLSGKVGFKNYKLKKDKLLYIAKRYKKYPLYTAPQNLLSTISLSLPVFIIGAAHGLTAVGSYWLAMRVLHLPSKFLGRAIQQVFFREAASLRDNSVILKKRFDQTVLMLIGVIIAPAILIIIWGPDLFVIILGKEWLLAGDMSRWLILFIVVAICNPPATAICQVYEKNDFHLKLEVVQFFGRIISLTLPAYYSDSLLAVIASYSIFGALFNTFFIVYVRNKLII